MQEEITKSVNEIKRVLTPGGICCINFLSVLDSYYGEGEKLGKNEFLQIERGEKIKQGYIDYIVQKL